MTALPANVWIWAVVALVFAAVVIYALSRGRGKGKFTLPGFSAEVDNEPARPGQERAVRVADKIDVDRGARVGNVTGVRGDAATGAERPVDVANDARIRGEVKDITGVDVTGGRRED